MDFQAYAIIAAFFTVAGLIVGLMGLSFYKGFLRKSDSYKEEPSSERRDVQNFNPRLILYGALFSVLSLSLLFLFPWAFSFKTLGFKGFLTILFFLGLLGVGLFYSWKKETLE